MALRVDFNSAIDGTSGRVDVMRVLASTGRVADDLNAAVVFSSNFLSAQIEEFTATISTLTPNGNNSASGSFTLLRKYKTHPLVFAAYVQTDGKVYHPYFMNQYFAANDPSGNGNITYTLERQNCISCDLISLGSDDYRLDYVLYNYGPQSELSNGVLRCRVVGQGI